MNAIKVTEQQLPDWLNHVQKKVESLRFGVVQIVIHDNKVTQIESTEKVRFDANRASLPQAGL